MTRNKKRMITQGLCALMMMLPPLTSRQAFAQQQESRHNAVMMMPQDFDSKYATDLVKAGSEASDFKMKTVDGKTFKLSKLRGKYVVLDFWASWCPDCRRDIPEMLRMYDHFRGKGVEFVGVSFDTDAQKWKDALQKYGIRWTQVSELVKFHDTQISKTYGVKWIPSMVLIDPKGKVVLSTVLWPKLERTLTELLPESKAKAVEEKLTIPGSKGLLSAIVSRPEGATGRIPTAIIMHGFGSNKNTQLMTLISDSLLRHGIATVRFDFNGHGESEGKFEEMTVPNEIEDAKKVYAYVCSQPWADSTRVALIGHSQGGVVASMTAGELGEKRVAAVSLLAPAAVLREDAVRGNTFGTMYDPLEPPAVIPLMGGHLKLGGNYVRTAFRLPIYEAAAGYHGPACIVHGTGDRVVPYTYGERYHNLWQGSEYDELPEFDHGFSQDPYRAVELVSEYVAKNINRK